MGFETERKAITEHFQDNWLPADGNVAYENHNFVQPENSIYLVFSILNLAGGQISLGGEKVLHRYQGEVQVDIYIPRNQGVLPGRTRADKVLKIFDRKTLMTSDQEKIVFRSGRIRQLTENQIRAINVDDIRYRLIVTCPFYRDEYK